MEKRYVGHGMRALTLLGCQATEALKVGKDYHLTALVPAGPRIYLRTLAELESTILQLATEQRGG